MDVKEGKCLGCSVIFPNFKEKSVITSNIIFMIHRRIT